MEFGNPPISFQSASEQMIKTMCTTGEHPVVLGLYDSKPAANQPAAKSIPVRVTFLPTVGDILKVGGDVRKFVVFEVIHTVELPSPAGQTVMCPSVSVIVLCHQI